MSIVSVWFIFVYLGSSLIRSGGGSLWRVVTDSLAVVLGFLAVDVRRSRAVAVGAVRGRASRSLRLRAAAEARRLTALTSSLLLDV